MEVVITKVGRHMEIHVLGKGFEAFIPGLSKAQASVVKQTVCAVAKEEYELGQESIPPPGLVLADAGLNSRTDR